MFTIHSSYNKDTMMDRVFINYHTGTVDKFLQFDCPVSMNMEDYCHVMESAVNKMITGS